MSTADEMVVTLKRDLQRLGEMLRDAERRAAHWRERALQSEASTDAEET